jgi:predicted enzyme related to lactoylglutathione lyase
MTQTGHHSAPVWFDISTPDGPRARRFYQDMFGWPVQVLDDTYALVGGDDGPPVGGIGQADADSPYIGMVVYFRVDDVDAALARAEQLGGSRTLDPVTVPGQGRMAVFHDLDGNPVGLLGP